MRRCGPSARLRGRSPAIAVRSTSALVAGARSVVLRGLVVALVGLNLLLLGDAGGGHPDLDGGDEATTAVATDTNDASDDDEPDTEVAATDAPVIDPTQQPAPVSATERPRRRATPTPSAAEQAADRRRPSPWLTISPSSRPNRPRCRCTWEPTDQRGAGRREADGCATWLTASPTTKPTPPWTTCVATLAARRRPGRRTDRRGRSSFTTPAMWSRGTVEYVQLGGHLNGRISNIVVIRQDLGFEGSSEPERTETRVMESPPRSRWSMGSGRSRPSPRRVVLPADRPADLSEVGRGGGRPRPHRPPRHRGVGHLPRPSSIARLLEVMLDIADRTPYSVVVLQTGHAYNVFGTDRVSNHSVGGPSTSTSSTRPSSSTPTPPGRSSTSSPSGSCPATTSASSAARGGSPTRWPTRSPMRCTTTTSTSA